ncbi:MAG: hypothetical protein ACJAT6_000041 [Akkermansiaceae bacterium]
MAIVLNPEVFPFSRGGASTKDDVFFGKKRKSEGEEKDEDQVLHGKTMSGEWKGFKAGGWRFVRVDQEGSLICLARANSIDPKNGD